MNKTKISSLLLCSKYASQKAPLQPLPSSHIDSSYLSLKISCLYISHKRGNIYEKNVCASWPSLSITTNIPSGNRNSILCTSMDEIFSLAPFTKDIFCRLILSLKLNSMVFIFCSLLQLLFQCFMYMLSPFFFLIFYLILVCYFFAYLCYYLNL